MPSRSELLSLIGELELDKELVEQLVARHGSSLERLRASAREEYDYAAVGYSLHNIYSVIESYALRIAKAFENHLDDQGWHRSLIQRMAVEVPEIRPQIWPRELAAHVDELRRFRHAFRHAYDSGLDPQKLMTANEHVRPAIEGFLESHTRLVATLHRLAELQED